MMLAMTALATAVIELVVLLLLLERRSRVLLASVGMNLLTNVSLNLYLTGIRYDWQTVLIGETLVILTEGLLYYIVTCQPRLSLKYSVICNVVSYSLGVMFFISFYTPFRSALVKLSCAP